VDVQRHGPGPWLKVNIGDHVRVVVDNKLPMSTGVHWHGLEVPFAMDGVPDVTQKPIKPGKQFTYDFVAKGPQLAMYHSHHNAQVQVPNGMLASCRLATSRSRRTPARSPKRFRWC
jgi:FtsP/CotA-like multicopper oxidase with cupredoxin domain